MSSPLPSHITPPSIIAICGNPKSGKSEVQKILKSTFGYIPIDDGSVIRRFAIDWLGLTEEAVYTQKGKASYVDVCGKRWQVRDILGSYGAKLEELFGPYAMPMFGLKHTKPGQLYSFGSCRKIQGAYYKQQGGVVIEVKKPDVGPSPYDFDKYDLSLVDYTINNDGTLEELNRKVIDAVNSVSAI